jgi:hypothetical protein
MTRCFIAMVTVLGDVCLWSITAMFRYASKVKLFLRVAGCMRLSLSVV